MSTTGKRLSSASTSKIDLANGVKLLENREACLLAVLGVLLALGQILNPGFLSLDNFKVILLAVAGTGVVAFGMTLVIVSGEIDLSVAGTAVLSTIAGALFINTGSAELIIGVTLATGLALGIFNGLLVTFIGIPSLIATLAMLSIARALANIISSGQAFYPDRIEGYLWFGRGELLGLPVPILVFLFSALFAIVLTRSTVFGRQLYATGGNEVAAKLSGIRVRLIKIAVFAFCGLAAATAGIMESARLAFINPAAFPGMELRVLAVTVLGGAVLAGGSGSITGTLLATTIIGVVNNLLNQLGVSFYLQQVVTAFVILMVVLPGFRQRGAVK